MKPNLIIAILLLFIISCKKKQESTHPLVGDITESVYASGIIKSQHQYQVYSTVSGTINAILVEEGNYVKKGSPLLSITNISSKLLTENAKLAAAYNSESTITYKLDQLKKNIDLSRSKMQNDSLLWQRQKNLYANQVGSLNQLELRELQYKSSLTAFETALLNYNDVKKQLVLTTKQSKNILEINKNQQNDFTIKSETDGLVYMILIEKGEMVNPQMPIAVITIIDSQKLLSPKRMLDLRPGVVHCVFDSPISTKGKTMNDLDALKEEVKQAMLKRLKAFNSELIH